MKYLKKYRLFEAKNGLTKKQEEFLNKFTKNGTWTYNPETGLVDVDGSFHCQRELLRDFAGVKFGKVSGRFWCRRNQLTSLAGSPQEVGEEFDCSGNNLISLEGGPSIVGESFDCSYNPLKNLEGSPNFVGRDFRCYRTDLKSLVGAPKVIHGTFFFDEFQIDALEWNPRSWLKVLGEDNPEARSLILTILTPEILNKEIARNPAGMILKLKPVWNDESFKETRAKLIWPKGYGEKADLVGDLDDLGF